jgi:hypothetical protein
MKKMRMLYLEEGLEDVRSGAGQQEEGQECAARVRSL